MTNCKLTYMCNTRQSALISLCQLIETMLAGSTSVRTGIVGIGFRAASMLKRSGLIFRGITDGKNFIGGDEWFSTMWSFKNCALTKDLLHRVQGNLVFSWMWRIWSPRLPILVKSLLQKLHWNDCGVSSLWSKFSFRSLGTPFCSAGLTIVLILKKGKNILLKVSFGTILMQYLGVYMISQV